jgi:hypothetical protein
LTWVLVVGVWEEGVLLVNLLHTPPSFTQA